MLDKVPVDSSRDVDGVEGSNSLVVLWGLSGSTAFHARQSSSRLFSRRRRCRREQFPCSPLGSFPLRRSRMCIGEFLSLVEVPSRCRVPNVSHQNRDPEYSPSANEAPGSYS